MGDVEERERDRGLEGKMDEVRDKAVWERKGRKRWERGRAR